jgi:hypothetical protein
LEPTLCSSLVSVTTAVPAEFKIANFSANSNPVAVTSFPITSHSATTKAVHTPASVAAATSNTNYSVISSDIDIELKHKVVNQR